MQRTSIGEIALIGAGGEPVDFRRTIGGHGVTSLWPMRVDEEAGVFYATFPLPQGRPRTVIAHESQAAIAAVDVVGERPSERDAAALLRAVEHVLRLDADLSPFYAAVQDDERLRWVAGGAGRMTRCSTVFEDVIKTICTTNCTWSATERMVERLVQHLGEPTESAPPDSPEGRAFPTAAAMAAMDDAFYRDVIKAGYRSRYLREIAERVASGALDLEALGRSSPDDVQDDELAKDLLLLPGIGPYAAAHVMMMLGRYSRLILDSWTRPTYGARCGEAALSDKEIEARFDRYGRYAGLAFWLTCTDEWIDDHQHTGGEERSGTFVRS